MGACFLYGQTGGGAGKVKTMSGAALPDSPTKNALWVQSDTAVTDYIFSPLQPEDAENGCVWLKTIGEGVNYILDKNQKLRFNLDSAYQYVDGVWKPVSVFLGTDSGWEEIVCEKLYLFHSGDQCTDITGDWGFAKQSGADALLDGDFIVLKKTGDSYCQAVAYTNNLLAIPSWATKLRIHIDITGNGHSLWVGLGTSKTVGARSFNVVTKIEKGVTGEYTIDVDVSGYAGTASQRVILAPWTIKAKIDAIWFER